MTKSIIQENRGKCYLCGTTITEEHHCWHGWANRRLADEDGLVVDLCPIHHRALHDQGYFDRYLQRIAERAWMTHYGKTEQDFIGRYGKSVLDGMGGET